MELTNTQYQRLCNVANVPHDDPSINELISAFQMQRLNLVACENVVAELRAENARLLAFVDKLASTPCENFTAGWDCKRDGRTATATDYADRLCVPCQAREVLDRKEHNPA